MAGMACTLVKADVGQIDSSATFTGVITAVEQTRDSITVVNDLGKVRMFAVSARQKQDLQPGKRVTVNFNDAYQWPLNSAAITVLD